MRTMVEDMKKIEYYLARAESPACSLEASWVSPDGWSPPVVAAVLQVGVGPERLRLLCHAWPSRTPGDRVPDRVPGVDLQAELDDGSGSWRRLDISGIPSLGEDDRLDVILEGAALYAPRGAL